MGSMCRVWYNDVESEQQAPMERWRVMQHAYYTMQRHVGLASTCTMTSCVAGSKWQPSWSLPAFQEPALGSLKGSSVLNVKFISCR